MLLLPAETAEASPETSIIAAALLELFQLAVAVRSWVLLSL